MQANHRNHVEQAEHHYLSLIYWIRIWRLFKLIGREWGERCTYHRFWRIRDQGRPVVIRLTIRRPTHSSLPCSCHEGVVDVVQRLCGSSRVDMSMMSLRELPHTSGWSWCCPSNDKWKQRMDSTGPRTIEPLFKFKYFCYFYFYYHHVICSEGLDQDYTSYTKGNILTLDLWEVICTTFAWCATWILTPQLTFPLNFAQWLTHSNLTIFCRG